MITQASKSKAQELQTLQEENAKSLALEVDKQTQAKKHCSDLEEQLRKTTTVVEEMQSKVESVSDLLQRASFAHCAVENMEILSK